MSMYMVDMILPNGHEVKDVMVSGLNLSICDALVGMDIITRGDFHLMNNGNTVFKFAIPLEAKDSI